MTERRKFDYAVALAEADLLTGMLEPYCERLLVCGSLRRRRPAVSDIEIVYIPKMITKPNPDSLFGETRLVNWMDQMLEKLITDGILARRLNAKGAATWGPKNKLGSLVKSGIPVDLFATTAESWWNYIVCRTGPKESNVAIASAAVANGWHWNPYGAGFTRGGELHAVTSEREVFEFAGLKYAEPWERK